MRIRMRALFGNLPNEFLNLLKENLDALSVRYEPYAVTKSYTFTPVDEIDSLQVNATAAAVTIYAPEQPVGNRRRTIIKTDASANAVTVNGNGNNINGAATQSLAAQYDFITIEPTGTEWLIVASS